MYTGSFLILTITLLATTCFSQAITISKKNTGPVPLFKAIEKQTDYVFFYRLSHLKNAKKVDIDVKNATLEELLDDYCKDQPFTYVINWKNVTIFLKDSSGRKKNTPDKKLAIAIKGRVMDEKGNILVGASIRIQGTNKGTITDDDGYFELLNIAENTYIEVTYIGFEPQVAKLQRQTPVELRLKSIISELSAVPVIINTGHQNVSKERATGSFSSVSSELLNRTNSTKIIDRLQGLTSGLRVTANSKSNQSRLNIRGRSTIFGNDAPLIVVNNFPYNSDLNNINPNDVEKIDVLKDAAAASIWGAYSGNGVIVITTKKGKLNRPLQIELESNLSIRQKQDVYSSLFFMTPKDLLEVESYLTYKGYFDTQLNDRVNWPALTPGVEIFAQRRMGAISKSDSARQIEELLANDVRRDFDKYFYRSAISQRYALNVNGGSSKITYNLTAGYDKNNSTLQYNDYTRYTFSSRNSIFPWPALQINVGIAYAQSRLNDNNHGYESINMGNRNLPGYAKFTDNDGDPIPITYKYAKDFIDTLYAPREWRYYPVREIMYANNKTDQNDIYLEGAVKYTILRGLRIDLISQYTYQRTDNTDEKSENAFFAADLINSFYNPGATSNNEMYPIPPGNILIRLQNQLKAFQTRLQLNLDRTFGSHNIAGIAGIEAGKVVITYDSLQQYGYDARLGTTRGVDYIHQYPAYMGLMGASTIPRNENSGGKTDINQNIFGNLAYNYANKYSFTVSGRIDKSNLFGVDFNNKAVPLWSAGTAWIISEEPFYNVPWMSYLKIRSSFGYNGNINKQESGIVTLTQPSRPTNGGSYPVSVSSAPNRHLRWERTGCLNFGVDIELLQRIKATIELYRKKGDNLVGVLPVRPSSGLPALGITYMANAAGLKTSGVDIDIQSINCKGEFKWITRLLFSFNRDQITHYNSTFTASQLVHALDYNASTIIPVAGKSISGIYSYRWAGLEPTTGDPMGYIDDKASKDYAAIINGRIGSLIYNGPSSPAYFGALNNSFYYKQLSLFVNICYSLGYFFRRSTISYSALFKSGAQHTDYNKRWRAPGDEAHTTVPSLPDPNTAAARDDFYAYAETNVHRADNIRLQEIRLTYDFMKFKCGRLTFKNIKLYAQGGNLGILWKADDVDLDPDFPETLAPGKTLLVGLKVAF